MEQPSARRARSGPKPRELYRLPAAEHVNKPRDTGRCGLGAGEQVADHGDAGGPGLTHAGGRGERDAADGHERNAGGPRRRRGRSQADAGRPPDPDWPWSPWRRPGRRPRTTRAGEGPRRAGPGCVSRGRRWPAAPARRGRVDGQVVLSQMHAEAGRCRHVDAIVHDHRRADRAGLRGHVVDQRAGTRRRAALWPAPAAGAHRRRDSRAATSAARRPARAHTSTSTMA